MKDISSFTSKIYYKCVNPFKCTQNNEERKEVQYISIVFLKFYEISPTYESGRQKEAMRSSPHYNEWNICTLCINIRINFTKFIVF